MHTDALSLWWSLQHPFDVCVMSPWRVGAWSLGRKLVIFFFFFDFSGCPVTQFLYFLACSQFSILRSLSQSIYFFVVRHERLWQQ